MEPIMKILIVLFFTSIVLSGCIVSPLYGPDGRDHAEVMSAGTTTKITLTTIMAIPTEIELLLVTHQQRQLLADSSDQCVGYHLA